MSLRDAPLVRPEKPAFDEGRYAARSRQQHVGWIGRGRLVDDDRVVAESRKAVVYNPRRNAESMSYISLHLVPRTVDLRMKSPVVVQSLESPRRPWSAPVVEDLPALRDLTLQSPIGGGEGGFGWLDVADPSGRLG
jgi:hypothetical protein